MKSIFFLVAAVAVAVPLSAAPANKPASNFNISTTSKVPGLTLEPGNYTIRVVNKLSDRMILRVDAPTGDVHSTFLGIQNSKIKKPASPGVVTWASSTEGANYLKGWYFAGSPGVVEFVYPKADAVAIAKSNKAPVLAIDPTSEGRPADNALSPEDMQLVTLWLLSPEQVTAGGNSAGIKAERYQVASVRQKPVISSLPHTASMMPWVWLLSGFFLLSAVVLRFFRLDQGRRRASSAGTPMTRS